MPICSNCKAEQPSSEVTSCILCGYPVVRETDEDEGEARLENEPLEFVVKEATTDSREFVGGQSEGAKPLSDDLGIETTTDLMAQEAEREETDPYRSVFAKPQSQPIGESSPPPPPPPSFEDFKPASDTSRSNGQAESPPDDSTDPSCSVKRLSDAELKKIEQNLYGTNSHLRDQEKNELVKKLGSQNLDMTPPEGPIETVSGKEVDRNMPLPDFGPRKPGMAKKGIGVAYFYRNYVQVTGRHSFITNDLLSINGREYVLKPKQIKTGYLIGGAALAFTILFIVLASWLTPGSQSGKGSLVGVVLDQYDQPYLQGATIRIPDLDNLTVTSDPRGFFSAGLLPVGTYEVEYIVDGQVVEVEQASVTGDEIRMLFLRPGSADEIAVQHEQPQTSQARAEPVTEPSAPKPEKPKTTTTAKKTESKPAPAKKPADGKVTLQANVKNARFEIDGAVVGAGNLTYSKIKAGKHRYRVSADGYEASEGSFTLDGGENHQLKVTLKAVTQAKKEESFQTEDYFYSGKTAFDAGDFQTAVADFTQTIKTIPSHADAHSYRAKAFDQLKENDKACADYIRAAEIYQIKNKLGQALACYNRVIEIDDKNLTAYLGRGSLYLRKGEELAAVADFDKATYLDKRCYQAYFGLGEARFKQQQFKKAISHFKDARSINEDDPLVHQYLMLSYLATNDDNNVKKAFEKFEKVATDDQMRRFRSDQKYAAVIKVVESQ